MQSGVLPVQVDIPLRGQALSFERLMVLSGKPSVRVVFIAESLPAHLTILFSLVVLLSTFSFLAAGKARLPLGITLLYRVEDQAAPVRVTLHGKIVMAAMIGTALVYPSSLAFFAGSAILGICAHALFRRAFRPRKKIAIEVSPAG